MNTTLKRTLIVGTLLSTAALAPKAQAQVPSTTLVISQVYGGGGATTGTPSYKYDYIELFNNSAAPIDLSAYSLQYNSSTGVNPFNVSGLTGTVAPNDYFLVQEGTITGSTTGGTLPAGPTGYSYNGTGTLALSGTKGQVALVLGQTALTTASFSTTPTTTVPTDTSIVDFVGYGTGDSHYEGTAVAPTLTTTTAAIRNSTTVAGVTLFTDTNNNGTDFTAATPNLHIGSYVYVAPAPEPSGTVSILVGAAIMGGLLCVARRRTLAQSQAA